MPATQAVVAMPFGMAPPDLFCPACGKQIPKDETMEPCAHVAFIYSADVDEFSVVAPAWAKRVKKATKSDTDESTIDRVLKGVRSKSFLPLSVTFGGMACGPVWYTIVVGIEFHPSQP